jgi:hypothetical protein
MIKCCYRPTVTNKKRSEQKERREQYPVQIEKFNRNKRIFQLDGKQGILAFTEEEPTRVVNPRYSHKKNRTEIYQIEI